MKKRSVFFKVILASVIVLAVFSNCKPDSDSDSNDYFKLKTTGIKSLYVSDMQVENGSRAIGSDNPAIQTLTYINASGQNSPVCFISPSGKIAVLEIERFERIDDQRTLASFTHYYEIRESKTGGQLSYVLGEKQVYVSHDKNGNDHEDNRILIDWSSGKVYDFNIYDYGNILFAQDGNLYTLDNGVYDREYFWYYSWGEGTIYKIDLNNISKAVPLNNKSFYPISALYAPVVLDNKIISYNWSNSNYFCFDINLASQPQKFKEVTGSIDASEFNSTWNNVAFTTQFGDDNSNGDISLLIQDLGGSYWHFNLFESTGYNLYMVCKPAIDNTGQMSYSEDNIGMLSFNPDYFNNVNICVFFLDPVEGRNAIMEGRSDPLAAYRNNGVLILFEKGFVRIRKKARGLQVDSVELAIPDSLGRDNCFINKDNYLYWLEGTAIKRLYLESGQTQETVYSDSGILNSASITDNKKTMLTASGSNLIFYKMAANNISVHTYSIPMYQPGAAPILLSTSDINARDIVELDF
jgi:hypothetical protein